MADQLKNVDKNMAFILELVGIIGFLGIGHIYSGLTTDGIIRLAIWLIVVCFMWGIIVIGGLICLLPFCLTPIMLAAQLGIPIWSAFTLKKRLEAAFPG